MREQARRVPRQLLRWRLFEQDWQPAFACAGLEEARLAVNSARFICCEGTRRRRLSGNIVLVVHHTQVGEWQPIYEDGESRDDFLANAHCKMQSIKTVPSCRRIGWPCQQVCAAQPPFSNKLPFAPVFSVLEFSTLHFIRLNTFFWLLPGVARRPNRRRTDSCVLPFFVSSRILSQLCIILRLGHSLFLLLCSTVEKKDF